MKQSRIGRKIALWLFCMVMVFRIVNLPSFTTVVNAAGLPIMSVDVNVAEPFAGEIPQLTCPEAGTGYEFTDIFWSAMDKPNIKHTGAFVEGKRYVVSICVKPTVGNKLASKELFSATINGKTARLSTDFNEDVGGYISYIFPATRSGVAHGEGWWIDNEETLHFIGAVTNPNSYFDNKSPWIEYKDSIKHVVAHEGSSINSCDYLFGSLTELADADLSKLDTSAVTGMSYMFYKCENLESVNLRGINTSNVTSMACLFNDCFKLKSVDLSGLDTSKVKLMFNVFYMCYSLTDVNVSGIDTSSVTHMNWMFGDCTSLRSVDVSDFKADSLTVPNNMFTHCSSLTEITINSDLLSKVISDHCLVSENLLSLSDFWANKDTGEIYKSATELASIREKVTLLKETSENHDFTNQPYVADADGIHHNQACKVCGYVKQGNHDFSKCVSNGDGTHKVICTVCDTVKEGHDKDTCSGGTATCTKKAVCEDCGEEYGKLAEHTLKTTTTTKATLTADGKKETKCTVCGKVTKTTKIYAAKTVKLSKTTYTYDGKAKKPTVTIKDSKGNAIATTNYTVKYDDGRKNVGKYNVKITFKGDYKGSKTLTFTINPKATTLKSVTPASKAFTAKWTKQTTQVDGYELEYALDKNFTSSAKKVTVSKNTTTSKKISSLKAKKTYYVRVRTYKKVGTKKYYSDWSKTLNVKTK